MNIAYGNIIQPASVGGVNDYHIYIAYVVILHKEVDLMRNIRAVRVTKMIVGLMDLGISTDIIHYDKSYIRMPVVK